MNPTYDFSGRVAFITGASSGMGLATARAFADAGAAVSLADVADHALHAAETQLRDEGRRAGIQSPMTDAADEPAEMFDRINAINLRDDSKNGNVSRRWRRRTSAQRLVSYRVSTTPPANVRVSTRSRFIQLSSAVKNAVPPPTTTG